MRNIILPSDQDPEGTEHKKQIINSRNELVDAINREIKLTNDSRDLHGETSKEFGRAESRRNHIISSNGEEIKRLNEKLYGKQGKIF